MKKIALLMSLLLLTLATAPAYAASSKQHVKKPVCHPQMFGFWGLNGSFTDAVDSTAANLQLLSAQTGMNAYMVSSSPSYAISKQLPASQTNKLSVAFRMSGSNTAVSDASGNFVLSQWESLFSSWTTPDVKTGLTPYLGSILHWHMLLDDIDTFNGHNPTAAELEAMAAASKAAYPTLKTFIRQDADEMPNGNYPQLDAVLNQYTAKKGDLSTYISDNLKAAGLLKVQSIWGLNIVDGGDGSSGQTGSTTSKYLMTPDEIQRYGEALLKAPHSLGVLMWEYDAEQLLADGSTAASHFSASAYQQAFQHLAALAKCQ